MNFYTDVSIFKNHILLRGYDNGTRIQKDIPYRPYLFVPSNKETEYHTVAGQPVAKMDFESIYAAKDFIKQYKDVSGFNIYGMDRFVYPFISDSYQGTVRYDMEKIRVMGLDIEVDTEDGYPDIAAANKHITAITYRIGNVRTVLGLKEFDKNKLTRIKDKKNIYYYQFDTEEDLLRSFLQLWEAADIDVVTGWNIELFDIPYIVKRIQAVLGNDEAKRLSPWKRLNEKTILSRGQEHQAFYPVGIAILDYMVLYKKFTYTMRESYSLNYISYIELGEKKMDYAAYEGLAGLYRDNHQLFIEYNIIDVDLIFQLEDKLRLIELAIAIAYDAKVNFADSLGSVLLWDVLIMNYLMERKIVVDPNKQKPSRSFEGGYVKDPIIGMHDWVVSFDLTSLYPHLIMQYNISPETFVKRIPYPSVDKILDTKSIPTVPDCSMAANGCAYRKDKYGFLPALMALQFKLRTDYKNQMIEAKKLAAKEKTPELEKEISRLNNAQMAKKIQLNSAYGAVGNEWFRWYDPNHAEAITLSGQLSIRWIANEVNDYMRKVMESEEDFIIAVDTDSIYVKMGDLVKKVNPDDPITFLDTVGKKKLEPYMHKKYEELAKLTNAYANKMLMKREAIADKVIWRAKKNYIANVWDNEGVRFKEPELKMMGIEAVRSSTPEICRTKIKEVIKLIVTTDEITVQKFIADFRAEYQTMSFEDIAFPRTVKNMSKYHSSNQIYGFKTPAHTKAALLYNHMIRTNGLSKKYPLMYDMDKIKWAYLIEPNPLHETVIGAPSVLPKELQLHEFLDYDLMFDKSFLGPVKSLLDVIGWSPKKQAKLMKFFDL